MKHLHVGLFVAAMAVAIPSIAFASPPTIVETEPRGLVAYPDGPGSYRSITLRGHDLVLPSTTGYTLDTDTAVYAYWDGTWHTGGDGWLASTGWVGSSERTIRVPPLRHGGTLVLYLCTTQGCSRWDLPVRGPSTERPEFRDPVYRRAVLDASVPIDDPRRDIRVSLDHLDNFEDTAFAGMPVAVDYMDAYDGVIDLWLRDNTAGRYWLAVSNRTGWSAIGVDLIERPVLTSRTPETVTSLPTTISLTFRDEHSQPESPWARLDVPGCASQWVYLTSTGTATWNVTMPTTCRASYASFDATLVVENLGGSSSIVVPVRPVTVTSPGPRPRLTFP